MVYCGKPSKSCQQCRKRDIKCDRKRDSCGQCIRAKIPCPGYLNPEQLVFRDQTQFTIQKANTKTKAQKQVSAPPSLIPYCPDRNHGHDPPRPIFSPADSIAKSSFIHQYVLGPDASACPLSYMQTFYPPRPGSSHLETAIGAAALAFFFSSSSMTSSSAGQILQQARKLYISALSLTKEALQSPEMALGNRTLLTVLILDLFEKLIANTSAEKNGLLSLNATRGSQSRITTSNEHLQGAITLVKLRGEQQFQDKIGLRMFCQMNDWIMVNCLERGVKVPAELVALRQRAAKFIDPAHSMNWSFSDVVVRYAGLKYASISKQNLSDTEIIIVAKELDHELQAISAALPRFGILHTAVENNSLFTAIFGDKIHIYPSSAVRKSWNHIRVIRILLLDLVRQHTLNIPEQQLCPSRHHNETHLTAVENIISLCAEICISASTGTDNASAQQHAASLLFPFYTITCLSIIPKATREYAIQQCRCLGETIGVRGARTVARLLEPCEEEEEEEGRGKMNMWSVWRMLAREEFGL